MSDAAKPNIIDIVKCEGSKVSDRIGTCRRSGWAQLNAHYEQESCLDFIEQNYELGELRAEVARHHRDFERISAVVQRSITNFPSMSRVALLGTLREVRGIVG